MFFFLALHTLFSLSIHSTLVCKFTAVTINFHVFIEINVVIKKILHKLYQKNAEIKIHRSTEFRN